MLRDSVNRLCGRVAAAPRRWLAGSLLLACCCGGGAGCGIPAEQHNATRRDLERLRASLALCSQQNEGGTSEQAQRRASLEARCAAGEAQAQELRGSLQQARSENAKLQAAMARMQTRLASLHDGLDRQEAARTRAFRSLQLQFFPQLQDGQLELLLERGEIVVRLDGRQLFTPRKAKLTAEAPALLHTVVAVLLDLPGVTVEVAGRAGSLPTGGAKLSPAWRLASLRAAAVARSLVESGLAPEQVTLASRAELVVPASAPAAARRPVRPAAEPPAPLDLVVRAAALPADEAVPPAAPVRPDAPPAEPLATPPVDSSRAPAPPSTTAPAPASTDVGDDPQPVPAELQRPGE